MEIVINFIWQNRIEIDEILTYVTELNMHQISVWCIGERDVLEMTKDGWCHIDLFFFAG